MTFSISRNKNQKLSAKAQASILLQRIWRTPDLGHRSRSYFELYRDILASSLVDTLKAEQFAEVIDALKQCDLNQASCADLVQHIRAQDFKWLPNSLDDRLILHALELAVRLWLFVPTKLTTDSGLFREAIEQASLASFGDEKADDLNRLSDDFSIKSLERRGGFVIHWTSNIAEHLTCVDKKVVKVFRHGSVLQSYLDREDDHERELYPPDLLSEIDKTLYLLFPYEGDKATKRMLQESKKRQVDLIEASWADDAVSEYERLQLNTYPRFRNRLAEIQRRYDAAKPMRPKQWWYDRRQRSEWAALVIAVLVLILTVITVVTSIMQVYAAFRDPH